MLADENEQNVLRGKGISQKQQQKLWKRSERRKNEVHPSMPDVIGSFSQLSWPVAAHASVFRFSVTRRQSSCPSTEHLP